MATSRYNYTICEIESIDTSEFPDENRNNLMSLEKYLRLARWYIRKHAKADSVKSLLASEDAISIVAYNMMLADWSYNPNRGMKKSTWRLHRGGNYGLKKYNDSCFKKKNKKIYSTSYLIDTKSNTSIAEILPDKSTTLAMELSEKDRLERNKTYVKWLLRNTKLSKTQREYINLHFHQGMTCEQIADSKDVSPQSVSQLILAAIDKIKVVAGANIND